MKAMRKIIVSLLRFYRKFLSPLKPRPTCRFYPTCSQYAIDAVTEWGVIRGGAMSVWRILRCNPFCRGGVEFVPKNHRVHREMITPRVRRHYSGAGDSYGLLNLLGKTKENSNG